MGVADARHRIDACMKSDNKKNPEPGGDHAPGGPAPTLTRRRLLGVGAVLPIVAAPNHSPATAIEGEMPWQEGRADAPTQARAAADTSERTWHYFTHAEAAFVQAAMARLIPQDALGPGALEAGAAVFLDRQLAGDYGRAARWYMQGPWSKGESTQGWQSRLTPAGQYRHAIKEIDEAVAHEAAGASFAALAEAAKDDWLHRLEEGRVELPTVDAKAFFKLLWQNTLEGFWSDPIYGGNRDMAGWKLIGFPGARYDQTPYVGRHGEAYPLPPVGLRGRPDWNPSST